MFLRNRSYFIFVFFFTISSFLFVSNTNIRASATLFSDNFNNGNSSGWEIAGTPGWQVVNGEYGIFLNPGISNTFPTDLLWNYDWKNITYKVDVRGVSGTDKNILIKYVDPSNFIEIHHTGGNIYLEKYSSNSGHSVIDHAFYPLDNNVVYHFRIDLNSDNIKVYIDNNLVLQGNEEPPLFQSWKIGLRAGTGAVSSTEVWFDNVLVTDIDPISPSPSPSPTSTPSPLPSLNVPDIKQFSSPWGQQIYDTATSWSENPYIKNWGCALTSATMILKYHGHNIDPGSLNNWLKNTADGYLGNGLVNWLAITRFAKQDSSNTASALEFKILPQNSYYISNEILNNRPVILSEPGHFVVAKSQLPTTFGINDPGYSNRPTLDSYNNSFTKIYSFIPSHTDLSYIELTINPAFLVQVYGPNGSDISDSFSIENPLVDDINGNQTSGQPLGVFLSNKISGVDDTDQPNLPNGIYQVYVYGTGNYQLNSYIYDVDGNAITDKKLGVLVNGQSDKYTINYGVDNILVQVVTIDDIINELDRDYNSGLISTKSPYMGLRNELLVVKNAISKNQKSIAKTLLLVISKEINIFSPKFIKSEAANSLSQKIGFLENSF